MADRLTIISGEIQRKWPKEGDVFYFRLSDGRFGYGMVALGNIDVGPFKGAVVIYIYKHLLESIDAETNLDKNELLLPPIITDASCWKKGFFTTYKKQNLIDMDVYSCHFFKNPIRNEIYDQHENIVAFIDGDIPLGRQSIQFYNNIIRSIENEINNK
ncbi:hypothetical protein FZU01_22575 [Salmonella enterica subsp. enterica]|nr:hypothetical protein [Salmonella enterica subsp. enterica serovar Kintambo]ECV5098608.1 hypothetical protein [Salmonella enterica subsp. enterica serovar Kintambo]